MAKQEQEDGLKKLADAVRFWGWPGFFKALPKSAWLVTDKKILDTFKIDPSSLKCGLVSPDDVMTKPIKRGINTVLVFTLRGEWALTKRLARLYPKLRVCSAQYHLAANSLTSPLRIPATDVLNTPTKLPKAPIVMLSTPGSDGEFIAKLLEANGLPAPKEYFAKPFLEMLEHIDDFRPLRFLLSATQINQTEGPFAIHLQTDLLQALVRKNKLSVTRLRKWLKLSGARVLYVHREDRLHQAALLSLMHERPMRSIWTLMPAQAKQFPGKFTIPKLIALEWISQLDAQEAWLEEAIEGIESVLKLEIPSTTTDQQRTLATLCDYLNLPAPTEPKLLDYKAPFETPELREQIVEFQREMIDRLGLHVL